jgi:hypothetical protein
MSSDRKTSKAMSVPRSCIHHVQETRHDAGQLPLREGQKVGKPKTNKVRCLVFRSCRQPLCVVLTMLADKQAEVVVELVTVVRTQSY